jgi:hypothetical protein
MSSGRIIIQSAEPSLDANANLINGATLTFLDAVTLAPAPVYSDRTLATSLGNVITASGGFFPDMWASTESAFRVQWRNAAGALIRTFDRIEPLAIIDVQEVTDIAEAAATAAVAGPVADANAAAAAAAASATSAAAAASVVNGYFPAALSNVPRGVVSAAITAAGSGGTNGTFALAFSGGNLSVQPTGTFTVSGGAVTAVSITGAGLYVGASISLPTVSLAASSGLTGATVTIAADFLIQSGRSYWTDHASDATLLQAVQNAAGTATALSGVTVARNVSALAADVDTIEQQIGSADLSIVSMAASGTNVDNTAFYGMPGLARTFPRRLTHVRTRRNGTIRLAITRTGGSPSTVTLAQTVDVTVVADTWLALPTPLPVLAGEVPWARAVSAGLTFASGTIPNGGSLWVVAGGTIGTDTSYTSGTVNGTQVEYRFEGEVAAGSEDGAAALSAVGTSGTLGFTTPIVNTGDSAPATFAVIMPQSSIWTHVTGVTVGQQTAGTGTLTIATFTGDDLTTIHSQTTVSVPSGVSTIPVTASIPPGASVVWQSAGRFQANGGGAGTRFINKALEVGDDASANPHRFELRILVASGLTGRVGVLEANAAGASEPLPIRPNDPWARAFGYRTILEQSATALRGERAIAAALDYRASNPGAGLTFKTNSRWIDVQVLFNAVATRDDNAFDDFAEVLVDGVTAATWTGSATAQRPRRVIQRVTLGASMVMRTVEIVCPYGDGMVIEGFQVEGAADCESAATAPTNVLIGVGDSITQGYNTTKPSAAWLWLLGKAMTRRTINLGIGGQTASSAHIADAAAAVAADGANATILWMIGVNNGLQQLSVSAFKSQIAAGITAARAAAPSAKIVCIGPPWCPNAEALTIPQDSYRTAMSEAVSESTAGNVFYVNAKPAYANDSVDIPDGVHPQDAKNATLATWLSTRV